jgi:D-beta-D-heptose 7-phosphate kinase/D-beta-D-heptose 1-phosphate adenosyltransferase
VVGHDIVEAHGGEVLLVDTMPGFSTTMLVNRARQGTVEGKVGGKAESKA